MKPLKDWIVPWLYKAREYNVGILDTAMDNPQNARLMLNENPIPPSDKVIEAVADSLREGNWYPDSFLRLRTKIGKMYGLGPDNVALCNGSSDTIDSMNKEFALKEARFSMLLRADPERAEGLLAEAQRDVDEQWHLYEQMAGIESLPESGEPQPGSTPPSGTTNGSKEAKS